MSKVKKHTNDKFYTKKELAIKLIGKVNISEFDMIIEPSAGDGSFYNNISAKNKIGLDIDPENENILKMDWFNFTLDKEYNKILIIGNPPFGRQGALALKFIKKCDELKANTIAFILPKSFKKESYKNRIPPNYHIETEIDLEDNSFTLLNNDFLVPCVFQVWVRKEDIRNIDKLKTTCSYLSFVKKSDNPDYAFRRVGFYAGKVFDNYQEKSEESHYFIKSDSNIKNLISNIQWDHNNTTGPRSIGKSEIIKKLDSLI